MVRAGIGVTVALTITVVMVSAGQTPAPNPSAPPPAQTTRDTPVAARRIATGAISGRVYAAVGNQPLSRATITLSGAPSNVTAVTDDRGEYELTAVPVGSYVVTATRAGYLPLAYGQKHPREAGRKIDVRDSQTIKAVDFALQRGAVLAGRVSDELGEPFPFARVEAMEPRYLNGQRMVVQAGITTADDLGEFRLPNLEPGTYTIRASATDTWLGDGDNPDTFAYATTYFPGVMTNDRAEAITVTIGQEVVNLDFALIAGRAAKVTGRVENVNGEPVPDLPVSLSRIGRSLGGALLSSGPGPSTRTNANGDFEIAGVPPGEFIAIASLSGTETIMKTVMLNTDSDISGLTLAPRRSSAAVGNVTTDMGTAPPFAASLVQMVPIQTDDESPLLYWGEARTQQVRPDWTFSARDMNGHYLFRISRCCTAEAAKLGLPDGWMVKAVRLNGRDITEEPVEIVRGGPDLTGLQIILSQQGAGLSGYVVDEHGAPLADSTVVVFASDPSRWGAGSRYIKTVRPDDEGNFLVNGLPSGSYFAIARDYVPEGQWEDPKYLQALSAEATVFQLREGSNLTDVSLKVEVHP